MAGRETSAQIDVVAAEWAVHVDNGSLDPKDQAALDSWLAADRRRFGAFARARAALAHAKRAKALSPAFDPDAYADAVQRSQVEPAAGPATPEKPERADQLPSRRRVLLWGGSLAAAGTMGMLGSSWLAAAQTYRTSRGEVRPITLEDGSQITLNTLSEVRVLYRSTERHVELLSGEVLFDVARDPARPFVVLVGALAVKAIGTSFTVRRIAERPIEVLVQQGMVEIANPSMSRASAHRIEANVRAIAAPSRRLVVEAPMAPAEVNRQLAWREGMLAFEDVPLSDAAAEFARYSDVQIRFGDPSIGAETVTGFYAANNPRGFAQTVALSLGLRTQNHSDGVILTR